MTGYEFLRLWRKIVDYPEEEVRILLEVNNELFSIEDMQMDDNTLIISGREEAGCS